MLVYNDVIDSQIVDDALTPLLDVVAVQGRPADLVCSRFDKLHYKPFLRKCFSKIHISLVTIKSTLFGLKRVKLSAFEKSETTSLNSILYHRLAHSYKTICVQHAVAIPRRTNATT